MQRRILEVFLADSFIVLNDSYIHTSGVASKDMVHTGLLIKSYRKSFADFEECYCAIISSGLPLNITLLFPKEVGRGYKTLESRFEAIFSNFGLKNKWYITDEHVLKY